MVKTYDASKVAVIIGGFVMGGYADGSFINVEHDEDAFALQIGTDGEGTRSKTNNRAGTVTLTLQQGSDSNDVLSGFAAADQIGNSGLFPLLIKDGSGRTVHQATTAWIQKMPATEFGREAGQREWVIRTDELISFVGGN